jgi:hypothetical protein
MKDKNDFTENSITVGDPQGSSASEPSPNQINIDKESGKIEKMNLISTLNELDEETIKSLLAKKDKIVQDTQTKISEGKVATGVHTINGQTYFVCPRGLFEEDSMVGAMVVDYARELNAKVKVVSGEALKTKNFDEGFMKGVWFGLFTSTNQKRRRTKNSYNLGLTCMFSLLVKYFFLKDENLGLKALAKDNFFFGNNPQETEKKMKVYFKLKVALSSFYVEQSTADTLYQIIAYAAGKVMLNKILEGEVDKIINGSMIPLDKVILSCYPTITVKKGKKEEERARKPKHLRSSPLFTKEEMEVITKLSAPLFYDFNDLSRNYCHLVFMYGFKEILRQIRETISKRWELLQRFSRMTKERLQAIRKLRAENANIKKAGVTPDHVDAYLSNTKHIMVNFVRELKHIFEGVDLQNLISMAEKKSVKNIDNYLMRKAFLAYSQRKDFKEAPVAEEKQSQTLDSSVETAIKLVINIRTKLGALAQQASNLTSMSDWKWIGRSIHLVGLNDNLSELFEDLKGYERIPLGIAFSAIDGKKHISVANSIMEMVTRFGRLRQIVSNSVHVCFDNRLQSGVVSALEAVWERYGNYDENGRVVPLNKNE